MKTLTVDSLKKAFPLTKSALNINNFSRSQGWLTNRFFMIKEELEPKFSQAYRFKESDIKITSVLDKATKKLSSRDTIFYETAEIMNEIELSFEKTFLIRLKSEHFSTFVNPRYLTYLLSGTTFINNLKIMITENLSDPILITDKDGLVIYGAVMGFRRSE